ncbi:MAG: ABC transporter ATP-binding protein/permease [Lachnospirales bacterium]
MINKKLLSLVPNLWKYITKVVFFQWLSLLCSIISTTSICLFINHFLNFQKPNIKYIIILIGIVFLLTLLKSFFTKKSVFISTSLSQKAKLILRSAIFSHLTKLGQSYQTVVPTAEAVQVSVEGVEQLESYFGAYLPQLLYSIVAPVTLFAFILFLNAKAAFVLLICVPLIPLSIIAVQKFAKKLLNKYWNAYTDLGDSFLENIQGLTTLKIYEADEKKHEDMNRRAEHFRKATMRVLIMQLNSISVMDIVAYGGAAAGIITMLYCMNNNTVTFVEGIIIVLLSAEFFIPMRQLGSFFHIAMNGVSAAERIFKIINTEIPKKGNKTYTNNKEINIENLYFSYDKNKNVLNNINIKLNSKGLYSFVGKSGCGKSTMASLLTGRLRDYKGNIIIGNTEINNISEKYLMELITLIKHNSYIFKGTVKTNLKMGKKNATNSEMENAMKMANLSELSLNSPVLEQGSNLSGGQRQRLALARAILNDTPIYIFDEATSNIDAKSEEAIMKAVIKLSKEKLVILISHRLANVVTSDKIFVMDNGIICEEGTHSELIKNNNLYLKLYNNQISYEKFSKGVLEDEK